MTVEFLLKSKKGNHYIYIAIYQGDDIVQISTGEKTTIKEWDKVNRRPKNQDSDTAILISKMKDDINRQRRLMVAQDLEVTPKSLRARYLESRKEKIVAQKAKDEDEITEAAFITTLAEKYKKEGLFEYAARTQSAVKYSIGLLQDFLRERYPRLERKELTLQILNRYALYLEEEGVADSSHGTRMKHVRWFLSWMGFSSEIIEKIKIRSVKQDERNIIPLTEDELKLLEAYECKLSEHKKAKDMYLLGCYTGLRISDLKRINKHRIVNGSIEITQQKNRRKGNPPLLPQTEEILKRYDWHAPKISEAHVNKSIKKVCELAKINTPTFFKRKEGGKLIETLHPKYELITIHTAIKTFISMAGERWGLRAEEVSAIVGKDVRTIIGYYLKPNLKEAKIKMLEAENRAKMKVV